MSIKESGIEKADILIGIPSYNEEKNIGFVTSQVALGLKKYFPDFSSAIINLDGDSSDNTKQAFLESDSYGVTKYFVCEPGVSGKGNVFYKLFSIVKQMQPKAVAVVDADLKNITPEWVKNLCQPVLDSYDYVTPFYARHKYDGTITNNIVYPLFVGLFGKNIRQPIGGDFGFSSRLAEHWLMQEWDENTRQFGIDIFMTTHAVIGGFKVCSAYLGAKVHKIKDPNESLGLMFQQVIGTLFNIVRTHHEALQCNETEDPFIFGDKLLQEPPMMCINTDKLLKAFNSGRIRYNAVLKENLSEESYSALKNLSLESSYVRIDVWAKLLYDLLVSYDKTNKREELIEAITPLYSGRVYSFAKESAGMDQEEAEMKVQQQALVFYELRDYALQRLRASAHGN